jgi:hypothetical protein
VIIAAATTTTNGEALRERKGLSLSELAHVAMLGVEYT